MTHPRASKDSRRQGRLKPTLPPGEYDPRRERGWGSSRTKSPTLPYPWPLATSPWEETPPPTGVTVFSRAGPGGEKERPLAPRDGSLEDVEDAGGIRGSESPRTPPPVPHDLAQTARRRNPFPGMARWKI